MKIPFLDLKAQYAEIKPEIDAAIQRVVDSQHFILGPEVEACEKAIAAYCDSPFGIGVSSGSDAILMALMAEEIGPGDEVITTPFTFFATAGAIARVGATPVFVDIDPQTYNIDPALIPAAVTDRTRAIIPVHLYGQMADMDAIMAIANERDLIVIEDAAQAIGAERNGRRAGSIGRYGCLSFPPSKNLGAYGDAGMVLTNTAERAETLRRIRMHGSHPKYYHERIGGNFRLDAIQAAVINAKLPHLDDWIDTRQENANYYDELFGGDPRKLFSLAAEPESVTTWSVTPPFRREGRHVFNQYVVSTPQRDELRRAMERRGVDTQIYYPQALHLQECFAYLGYGHGSFESAEAATKQLLALPVEPKNSSTRLKSLFDQRKRKGK